MNEEKDPCHFWMTWKIEKIILGEKLESNSLGPGSMPQSVCLLLVC